MYFFLIVCSWSRTTPEERSAVLNRVADILESRLDEFARAESRDQGKPVSLAATVDIPRAIHNFRFFANSILYQVNSSVVQERTGTINYVQRCPVGVAGLISPVKNLGFFVCFFLLRPTHPVCLFAVSGTSPSTC